MPNLYMSSTQVMFGYYPVTGQYFKFYSLHTPSVIYYNIIFTLILGFTWDLYNSKDILGYYYNILYV